MSDVITVYHLIGAPTFQRWKPNRYTRFTSLRLSFPFFAERSLGTRLSRCRGVRNFCKILSTVASCEKIGSCVRTSPILTLGENTSFYNGRDPYMDPCAISKRYIYTHRLLKLSSALEVHRSSLVQVLSYACGQPDPLRASLPTSSLAFDRVGSKSWLSSGCGQSTLGK